MQHVAVAGWGGGDGLVTVYDAAGKEIKSIRNLPRHIAAMALTNDGKSVAVALSGDNPPVLVYDVESGHELKRFTGLHGRATWLAFAPDGKRIYAASTDTAVLAWDTSDVAR